jgi:hypothetical protein
MTYCNNLHERTSPIEIFFFGHTLSRLDRPDAARISMPCSPNHLHLCIPTSSARSLSRLLKKKSLSVFFRSLPGPAHSGNHTLLYCPPPIHPPNGKNSFLGCFALFQSSFSIHYHYSILSFFVLLLFSESQKRTPITPAPPLPCRTMFHACVCGWRFGLGSDSLDQSTAHFSSPVLYYLLITGDSVYLVVVVVVYSSFDTLTQRPSTGHAIHPSPTHATPTIR